MSNMLRVTDLVSIHWKFLTPERWKVKFLGAMGLRSLTSHFTLTSWQEKQLSVLKQRQTYIKRHWRHQELTWLNPPHSTTTREASRKPHLHCNWFGCCKKAPTRAMLCPQTHAQSPYGNEHQELKGNLLVPIYWRAFPSWHQLGGSFPKSGKNQFTHSPGKTPSASKTTLHYTLNPPQAHFKT